MDRGFSSPYSYGSRRRPSCHQISTTKTQRISSVLVKQSARKFYWQRGRFGGQICDNFQGTYVRPPDADDLSHIVQQPGELSRMLWTRFLVKKNQIANCPDAEALAAFKHSVRDEWLAHHLGQEGPRSMTALTALMTHFCMGEDSWLARRSNSASD